MHKCVLVNTVLTQIDKCLTVILWILIIFNLFFGENSDSNSSSSDGSRARSVQSSATHAPTQSSMVLDSDEPRRSFGIKVQNLPVRSTGEFLQDLHALIQSLKDFNGCQRALSKIEDRDLLPNCFCNL